ncbi:MAG: hypothetical protein IIB53_15225 [Planctomycetes bacterium]|nr:hypothetical protein [Planctomycetota bacterium]
MRLFFVYALVVILLRFHGVVLSFFIPQTFDLSLGGRIYGALLIGIPTLVVDILAIRHFGGQFFERRWIAENKRKHEEEMRLEHSGRQAHVGKSRSDAPVRVCDWGWRVKE